MFKYLKLIEKFHVFVYIDNYGALHIVQIDLNGKQVVVNKNE